MKVDRVKVSESSQRLTFVVFLHFSGVKNKSYSQAGDNGSWEGASGKPRLTDGSLDQWQAASQEAGPARLTHTAMWDHGEARVCSGSADVTTAK